jgi:hypothetical protein
MRADSGPGRSGALLDRIFGIDLRALAMLRIGIGLVLVLDLCARTRHFTASYTDGGPFPLALLDPWMRETVAPFHLWSGAFAYQALLFALSLVLAAMLLVGLHTRVAAVGSWLLLVSLQVRNPFLLNFGDHILRVCFFWALFLPLGRVWSLDARRAAAPPPARITVRSVASAAFLLQVGFVYFFTALLKTAPDWHRDGMALYYALQYDSIARPFALWLREQVFLTKLLTRGTFVLELVGPFLALVPLWPVRTFAALSLMGLHVGIALCLNLGIFPLIDIVVLLPFLPSQVWDRLEALVARTRGAPVRAREAVAAAAAASRGPWQRAGAAALGVLLAYVFAYNLTTVSRLVLPEPLVRIGRTLGLNQEWRMFTPRPAREDGRLVFAGRVADGRLVDLAPWGSELTWSKPPRGWQATVSVRWGFYLDLMRFTSANGTVRREHVRWLCSQWNGAHPPAQRLERIDVFYVHEDTAPPGQSRRLEKRYVASHECPERGGRMSPGWDVAVPESGAPPPPFATGPPPAPVVSGGAASPKVEGPTSVLAR